MAEKEEVSKRFQVYKYPGGICRYIRTPHQRPYARNQVHDLGLDGGICALAEGWVVGGGREVDCSERERIG